MKRVIIILCLIALIPPVTAQDAVTITAPAVQRTPSGLEGVLSYITVYTEEGSGHVYIDTWPLAEVDIQGSARLAVQVACDVVNKNHKDYDFFITVRSDSPIIGGPSAGGAITVAVIAALQGWELDPDVVMSGTINPDETVGPVGGLYQKAQAASEVADYFLVPEGQATILVEEQKTVQEGPFIYVTTTQKEVDLVEEGKKMGLEVREVYDIRDAVYSFTGKKIEPPQVKGEPIKADFMKPYAQEEIQETEEEYTATKTRINSYSGLYKRDLEGLLESAQEEIDNAKRTYTSGDYYTSVSASFVAGLYITYADNLLSYFEDQAVEDIFSGLDEYLTQLSEEVTRECPRGMTALQCIAAAQKRIFEAEESLKGAQQEDSVFKYIEYASYAQKRGESAEFWITLARDYQKGDIIDELTLRTAASSMVNTAQLSLVYASSILPQSTLLKGAEEGLETAQNEFAAGAYCAALFSGLESKVYSEVALITYASDESIITESVERARERASDAIEESRIQGIEPVLAVSYYELAESQENAVTTLIYLGYAEEIASIHTYIEGQPVEGLEVLGEKPGEDVGTSHELLFLGIGIFLGMVIFWGITRATR